LFDNVSIVIDTVFQTV